MSTILSATSAARTAPPQAGLGARLHATLAKDSVVLGVLLTAAFSAVGVWRALVIQYAVGDAVSRTYSADAALYSHEPHLAVLGFIWPPLPAFAQLILLRIAPGLSYYGLSGNLVTAISAGALGSLLLSTLRGVGVGRWGSIVLVAALFCNPMMAFYASNGMSEMPFLFFLTLAIGGYARWTDTGRWQPLSTAGFACAGMFFCRYDAAVIAPAMAMSVVPVMRLSHREFFPPKVEANLLAFSVPVVYVGFIWIYLNRLIMGDALYFWHSEYSNLFLTRTMKFSAEVIGLQQSLPATAAYFIRIVNGFSPFFLAACALSVVVAIWKRDIALITFTGLFLAAPVFQLWTYRSGSTFNLPRFYISVIISGLLLGAYVFQSMWRNSHHRAKLVILLMGVLVSNVASWGTMAAQLDPAHPTGVLDEGLFIQSLIHPLTPQADYSDDAKAAAYLNAHTTGRSILIDAVGTNVAVLSGHLDRFYVPSDTDWLDVATKPQGRVSYIVAVGNAALQYHAFLDLYPNLFENGTPFTTLEGDFGNVRLYRMNN